MRSRLVLAAVMLAAGCEDQTLSPTPEDLNVLTPTSDVTIVEVLPDTSFSVLRMRVQPGPCRGLPAATPNPAVQVSEDRLFTLLPNGRLAFATSRDFQSGLDVRIWAHPDGCSILAAAALLP